MNFSGDAKAEAEKAMWRYLDAHKRGDKPASDKAYEEALFFLELAKDLEAAESDLQKFEEDDMAGVER